MALYMVSADVRFPLLFQIEAASEEEAEHKVLAMAPKDALDKGYGGDGADVIVDDVYREEG